MVSDEAIILLFFTFSFIQLWDNLKSASNQPLHGANVTPNLFDRKVSKQAEQLKEDLKVKGDDDKSKRVKELLESFGAGIKPEPVRELLEIIKDENDRQKVKKLLHAIELQELLPIIEEEISRKEAHVRCMISSH